MSNEGATRAIERAYIALNDAQEILSPKDRKRTQQDLDAFERQIKFAQAAALLSIAESLLGAESKPVEILER